MHEKKLDGEICEYCGHGSWDDIRKPHYLDPLTILHGRYLLGRVLGEGGFGITYLALDLTNETRVAIKELFIAGVAGRKNTNVVLPAMSRKGQDFYFACKARFLQEAYILRQLEDKKGIVSVLDFFEENATAYIVMEYLEGEDLIAYLKSRGGRITWQEAFRILRPVMKSMIQVNRAGIIHRDISPDNIRHLENGRMKLIDFGSASQIGIGAGECINPFALVKHGYAPKEQYKVNGRIGPWMDVYSMSATFYRCITGMKPKPAFERKNNKDIVFPSVPGIEMPAGLEAVLLKGLALQPGNRYPDMWFFYHALKNIFMADRGNGG